MKKVAVVTRTKDRPLMLPRVQRSIAAQSFKDFVWVLVNDAGDEGPVDRIAELARSAGIDTIVVHRQESVGMEAASNDGVGKSESEYIVIHDDDDTWEPDFLAEMVRFLDENTHYCGAICHSTKVVEAVGAGEVTERSRAPYNPWIEAVHLADMLIFNTYSPISFLFRRELYEQLGGFDETLPVLGDWDFNLKALLVADIGVVPRPLANYHFREESSQEGAYGNSLNAGIAKHVAYDASYRHRKLREDLAANRVGLGFLLQQGRLTMGTNARLDILVKVKDLVKRGLGKVGLGKWIARLG